MIRPAFSTVACPDWTLDRVASTALDMGFECVELRTFGPASTRIACDPFLTGDVKIREMFAARGIEIAGLGTSVSFDEPISPSILGFAFGDTERTVRAAKQAIDLAAVIEAPLVRVFGFDVPRRETRTSAMSRIVQRLSMALDHARNTGVKVVIENGGAFSSADQLAELLDRVRHPLLGVCYSVAVGAAAGDSPERALACLAGTERVLSMRVKDFRDDEPCALGEGRVPNEAFVRAFARAGFSGPVIFEWDRLWMPRLAPAQTVLARAARTMFSWMSAKTMAASA
ncbi:MAG: sugar phosphate isomerase/epimerase family protein [Phycisphaerales bacterium]